MVSKKDVQDDDDDSFDESTSADTSNVTVPVIEVTDDSQVGHASDQQPEYHDDPQRGRSRSRSARTHARSEESVAGRRRSFGSDVLANGSQAPSGPPDDGGSNDESEEPLDDGALIFDDADTEADKQAMKAIHSLTCTQALDGEKLGNQERRYNELMQKMSLNDSEYMVQIAMMRAHKAVFQIAKESNIKLLPTLSEDVLATNLGKLVAAKVTFSNKYKRALWKRSVGVRLQSISSLGSDPAANSSSLGMLIDSIKPIDVTSKGFDPLNCRLADLDDTATVKFTTFQQTVMSKMFLPLIAKGTTAVDIIMSTLPRLITMFEDEVDDDLELPEVCNHVIINCLCIWRSLKVGRYETLDLSNPDDASTYLQAVTTILEMSNRTSSKDVKAMVGQVIVGNEFWKTQFNNFVDLNIKLQDMRPKIKMQSKFLQDVVPGNTESNNVLSGAIDVFTSALAILREVDYSDLGKLLVVQTLAHAAATKALESTADKVDKLKAANQTLHAVISVFPDQFELNTSAEEFVTTIQKADTDYKTKLMQQIKQRLIASGGPEDPDCNYKDLEACIGLPATDGEGMLDTFLHLLEQITLNWNEESKYDLVWARLSAGQLVQFLSSSAEAGIALDFFMTISELFNFMLDNDVRHSNEAWAFDVAKHTMQDFDKFEKILARASDHLAALKNNGFAAHRQVETMASKLDICLKVQTVARIAYLAKAQDKVHAALHDLEKIAGGSPDGKDWEDQLPSDPDFEGFVTTAQETMMSDVNISAKIKPQRRDMWKDQSGLEGQP